MTYLIAVLIEYKDRGFFNEALNSILSQTRQPDFIVVCSGVYRNIPLPKNALYDYFPTESEGRRIQHISEISPKPAVFAFIEDDDVWYPDHLKNIEERCKDRRCFISTATDYLKRAELGFNLSSMAVSADMDFSTVAYFPTLIDTVLFLEAVDEGFDISTDDRISVHYRIHPQNWSRNDLDWKHLRDRFLAVLPQVYPKGKAHELALYYRDRDTGN